MASQKKNRYSKQNSLMEPIEIEPNPLLINYFHKSRGLYTDLDGSLPQFCDNEEWHYILSNLETNIFLLKRLDERGLLKKENKIVDCGIGLGTALYDIMIQSQDFPQSTFEFTGIEKEEKYLNYLEENLLHFWNGRLNLIHSDIMTCDYQTFNIIYSYCPFKTHDKLKTFYGKISSEIKSGSVIIENREGGLGFEHSLTNFSDSLEKVDLDGQWIFVKK